MKKVLAINVLTIGLLLLATEIGGQLYYRWKDGVFLPQRYRQYLRDVEAQATVFEQHPYLVARPRKNVRIERDGAIVSTTSIHTRVTGKKSSRPDAITVAAVGGSTTFGTKLTDADTWPWLLQEKLGDGYAVINYGVPGYTTAEAVIQMGLIVPEAKPGVVVFYEGWNDIRNYHWPGLTADYYNHGMSQFETVIPQARDESTLWDRAGNYSFVLGLVNRALGTPVGAQSVSDREDPEVNRIYRRNLDTLRGLARHIGATALFVPQVLNEQKYSLRGVSQRWTPYIEDAAMPSLMRGFNNLMSTVCANDDPQCQFVPEALTASWNGDDFLDEGHFTREGADKFATILAARIRKLK